ncbi:hypothetical protein [Sphingomonas sp. BK235]|uniref:hypothetical protein n=1 Tax=Sphingomonas sp. BK235 TaxID=2512131 RepID=UPI0014050FEA|nr:hypothetical protein [Sphingomonas sp. BK235]
MHIDRMKMILPFLAGALAGCLASLGFVRMADHNECRFLDRGYQSFNGDLSGLAYASHASIDKPLRTIYRCWTERPWESVGFSPVLRGEITGRGQRFIAFDMEGVSDASLLFKVERDDKVTAAYLVATTKVTL